MKRLTGWAVDRLDQFALGLTELRARRRLERLQSIGLKIGSDVVLPVSTWIDMAHCYLISIGDRCRLGPQCLILAHDAQMDEFLDAGRVGPVVIGDAALKRMLNGSDGLHVTDLVTEWDRVHNLPFVFARWVVRKDAPAEVRRAIENWLAPLEQKDRDYVYASAGEEALRLGIRESAMVEYLLGMKRVLGPEELAGQERFVLEYQKFGREPVFVWKQNELLPKV